MDSRQTCPASSSSATTTQTEILPATTPTDQTNNSNEPATLRLRLQTGNTEKKVSFNAGTVDNEHMNKKKSKCCCIYRKPMEFGESSSEDEDECDNCFGHVENKKKKKSKDPHDKVPESE
ncbi:E3 ubiquitin-protein ligase PPP1R11 [Bradysia coprophila]|uniref:E3 ubiquitin-protein ligase PPP1R11 n=1 Tax=Bradysia coprophila TaxID=38358 RepID=UPI00187DD475|nr:E3 ubiquitin-protein ligase PPP1R11 [Bradysia coprophila]